MRGAWLVMLVAACQPRPATTPAPIANVATVDAAVSRPDAWRPPASCGARECSRNQDGFCVRLVQRDCPGYEGICYLEMSCDRRECCPPR